MANNSLSSGLPMFLLFTILLAMTLVSVAGRKVSTNAKVADKKQPESFIGSDGNVLIPGIGRVQVPTLHGASFFPPYSSSGEGVGNTGEGGDSGTGSIRGGSPSYIPGGDDTFIPNPGVEIPGGSGEVPVRQTARP